MDPPEAARGHARAAAPPVSPDEPAREAIPDGADASLLDDVDALFADGRTYLQAELQYQKSRAGFAADRARSAAIYGLAALGLIHLALIALTVGVVIALAPLIGAWLATGAVAIVLAGAALVLLGRLRGSLSELGDAFKETGR